MKGSFVRKRKRTITRKNKQKIVYKGKQSMLKLKEIEELEIFVLVDNISDPFTQSDQGIYWNEVQYRHGIQKQRKMCGADYCRACNGLSLFLRAKAKGQTYTLLFDTGPDSDLIIENAKKLGLDLGQVDAIVLSHGHFDHYGGTLEALKAIGKKDLPVYVHPELFYPRAFGKDGKEDLIYVTHTLTKEQIECHQGKVLESSEAVPIFEGLFLISGEVPRETPYENGVQGEYKLKENTWECAPEVIDERCLIFYIKEKGLCMITGCGHTGIVNAANHALRLTQTRDLYFLMGGFHLAGPENASRLDPTLKDLEQINPHFTITGHCTGRKTQSELSKIFGSRHIPYGVGSLFKF